MCGPTSGSRSFSLGPSASPGLALSGDLRPLASGGARGDDGPVDEAPSGQAPLTAAPLTAAPLTAALCGGTVVVALDPPEVVTCDVVLAGGRVAALGTAPSGVTRATAAGRSSCRATCAPTTTCTRPWPAACPSGWPRPATSPRSSRGCGGGSTVLSTRPPSGRRPYAVVWTHFSRARPRSSTTMRPRTS